MGVSLIGSVRPQLVHSMCKVQDWVQEVLEGSRVVMNHEMRSDPWASAMQCHVTQCEKAEETALDRCSELRTVVFHAGCEEEGRL